MVPVGMPKLRQELRVHPGSNNPDGSPTWMLHDPVRNRFFQIGWLEYEMLARWQNPDPASIVQQIRRETPLEPDVEQVESFLQFLTANQLLEVHIPQQFDYLRRILNFSHFSGLKWLLHHYLFFRLPIVHPEGFLDRALRRIHFIFTRTWWVSILAVGLFGLMLVSRQWDVFVRTFLFFFTWQGLVFYGLGLFAAKCIHELGHALTARHFGVRVPVMGVAFMVMMPVLYTDTDETWKLKNRHSRLAIAAAGILAESCLAAVATLMWSLAPEGPLKSILFFLATASWFMTLAINLNPLMRFDGYYLFADWLDIPNLLERSFAMTRWGMRRLLLNLPDAPPEPARRPIRVLMMLYGYAVWIYRFFLFLGISLLVYHKFFKLLGLFLMLVEIEWFIARPIRRELKAWWQRRKDVDYWRVAIVIGIVYTLVGVVPSAHEVSLPALAHEQRQTHLFASSPGQVVAVNFPTGGPVKKGQILYVLKSPDLEAQRRQAALRVSELENNLQRSPWRDETREDEPVLRKQLNGALTDLAGIDQQIAHLNVLAPFDGVLRDVPVAVRAGAWINPTTSLGVVVGPRSLVVDAWLNEEHLHGVHIGERARFYPSREDVAPMDMKVVAIDPTSTSVLPSPMLASTYGGYIAVRQDRKGALLAEQALYRIILVPTAPASWPSQVMRGHLNIQTGASSNLIVWLKQAISNLIRESSF